MALWDLAGKAYNVPVHQMLGGKYRDQVRVYVDTPMARTPEAFAERMKGRIEKGFTFLKMDFGVDMIKDEPNTIVGKNLWDPALRQWEGTPGSYGMTRHPFTRIQITDKGLARLTDFLAAVREQVGYEVPIASDHYATSTSTTRSASAAPWSRSGSPGSRTWCPGITPRCGRRSRWPSRRPPSRAKTSACSTTSSRSSTRGPWTSSIRTTNSAGGILETKRIGDYAEEHGVAQAVHHAASPVSFLGSVHSLAATSNFIALEHHSVDNP